MVVRTSILRPSSGVADFVATASSVETADAVLFRTGMVYL